jgi:hypothetical protein
MDELQVQLRRVAEAFDGELPAPIWRDRQTPSAERRGPFLVAAALLVALLAFLAGAAVLGGGGADAPEPRQVERTDDGLRMILAVEDAVVPADDTLHVTLTLENVADHPVGFSGLSDTGVPASAVTAVVAPPADLDASRRLAWEQLSGFGGDNYLDSTDLGDGFYNAVGTFEELARGEARSFGFEWDPTTPQGPLFVGDGVLRAELTPGSGRILDLPITLTGDGTSRSAAALAVLRDPQVVAYLEGLSWPDLPHASLEVHGDTWVADLGEGSGEYLEILLDGDTLETMSVEIVVPRPPVTQQLPDPDPD